MIEDKPFLEVIKEEVEASKDVAHMLRSMYVRTGNPEYQHGMVQLAKDNLSRVKKLLEIRKLEEIYHAGVLKQSKPSTQTVERADEERTSPFFQSPIQFPVRNRNPEGSRCSLCGSDEGTLCPCGVW